MKVLFRLPRKRNSNMRPYDASLLLIKSIRKAEDGVTIIRTGDGVTPIPHLLDHDVMVVWGNRHNVAWQPFREAGKDVLMMELGYIGDRWQSLSLGWNGLNGRAKHVIGTEPRWEKLWGRQIIKPWSMKYDHVLLVGQVQKDTSVWDCKNIRGWYRHAAAHYQRKGIPVIFRKHPWPLEKKVPLKNVTYDQSNTLQEAMENALVVTWSSNVGVEAILAGRPTVAVSPGSMVHGWAARSLDEDPLPFDREPWLHRMAYCQWSLDELEDGTAWKCCRKMYTEQDVSQTIRRRRTCRHFKSNSVPKELLWKIAEAGMWAPSGYNLQNFRFLLINDKNKIKQLGQDRKTPRNIVGRAAACIVVFSDDGKQKGKENHIWHGLLTQNCSAAIENMLLTATDLGLGSCWISFLDSMDSTRLLNGKTWRELFNKYDIPESYSIHGLVLLGWPEKTEGGWPAGDEKHGGKLVEGRTLNRFLINRK